MYSYRTSIPATPPVGPGMVDTAMTAMRARPSSPGVDKDAYSALGQRNAVEYGRNTSAGNAQFVNNAQNVQLEMAMRGLQQLEQQRRNESSAHNATYARQASVLNSLLQGLYD